MSPMGLSLQTSFQPARAITLLQLRETKRFKKRSYSAPSARTKNTGPGNSLASVVKSDSWDVERRQRDFAISLY